ncbi:hypothetical protein M426DRAFT_121020 [Hypoxylon sp. CI-4A]|nr:hypothetical protein M426DRAFT_121020 [Hypoxylon sp. CI-4A]
MYTMASLTALSAAAAIMGGRETQRRHERVRSRAHRYTDENSPWPGRPRQQRPSLAHTRSRHTFGYYGQSLYYPTGFHEHYVHHVECPGSQCHYRAFLTDSIRQYNESRRALRQTYVHNLRELARMHERQPRKPSPTKDDEVERLHAYYVARVRDVFEDHRADHRRLFGQDYLCWTPPEREDPSLLLLLRSRPGSRMPSRTGSTADGFRDVVRSAAEVAVITEKGEGDERVSGSKSKSRSRSRSECSGRQEPSSSSSEAEEESH